MISLDEIIAEAERLTKKAKGGAEGFTAIEFAAAAKLGETSGRRRLKALIQAGKVVCSGRRPMQRMDGLPYQSPVYKAVKK